MPTERIHTPSGRILTIRTRNVSPSHGTIGQVVADGRVIYETEAQPYRFTEAALNVAREWAEAQL